MTTDNFCFYMQNRQIQTGQTGGQRYSDMSPSSIPWASGHVLLSLALSCQTLQMETQLNHPVCVVPTGYNE
jgi:hypothetical protein